MALGIDAALVIIFVVALVTGETLLGALLIMLGFLGTIVLIYLLELWIEKKRFGKPPF